MVEVKGESPSGFPGSCLTNAYMLEGFTQILYMVSTVAPGSVNTEIPVISRLKNAETELRAQSLLVALDIEAQELFTFHRLIDFQKDAKSILGRLAIGLRHNQCIISFKSVLKAAAILKSEHTRLRGVLLMAVFSSFKPNLMGESNFLPLGMRSFLTLVDSEETQYLEWSPEDSRKHWQLEVINLQLLLQGQILVVNTSREVEEFEALSDYLTKQAGSNRVKSLRAGLLCLAPNGRTARYSDGEVVFGNSNLLDSSRPGTAHSDRLANHLQQSYFNTWKELFLAWLAEYDIHDSSLSAGYWVEIDIPFTSKDQPDDSNAEGTHGEQLIWKRLFWPAALCFYFQHPLPDSIVVSEIPDEDPVTFVQDWILKSDEKARKSSQGHPKNSEHPYDMEAQLNESMDDDLGFGGTPQLHNAFATGLLPSQTMYPTPPDVPYTQATPGMSSVDGIGMTPVETNKMANPLAENQTQDDTLDQIGASGVGTGTYDEDLFEDLPHDRFGGLGASDEPDWGFFEQHHADMSHVHSQNERVQSAESNILASGKPPLQEIEMNVVDSENCANSMPPPVVVDPSSSQSNQSPSIEESKNVIVNEDGSRVEVKTFDTHVPDKPSVDVPMESPERFPALDPSSLEKPPTVEVWKKPALPAGRGRRHSLYDSSEDLSTAATLDERYTANGTFWFDPPSDHQPKLLEDSNGKSEFLSLDFSTSAVDVSNSSSSNSSYQGNSMDFDGVESSRAKRKWTEYEQGLAVPHLRLIAEDLERTRSEILEVLRLLRPTTLDHTWMNENQCHERKALAPVINYDQAVMRANILVDQVAQASGSQDDIWLGQNGIAATRHPLCLGALDTPYGRLEPAMLANLLKNIENDPQSDVAARLDSLQQHQICLLRNDRNLSISASAMSLWENLNLQPNAGRKDVQAHCIHPVSKNIETGCIVLLERMKDMYSALNLGDHDIGQLAGISNNGLVAWSDEDETMPTLRQICERLGTALARLPSTSRNVIFYMIAAPGPEMSVVVLVESFCILRDAYLKACNRKPLIEPALQIIPVNFITAPDAFVLRPSQDYLTLSLEVYNRFPPDPLGDKPGLCGSALVLSESPRRRIRFDIGGPVGASSEIGIPCLHLAYSFSDDGKWLVAVWTDERGYVSLTMCYSLKFIDFGASRTQSEIMSDMWEVSQDLMAKEQRRWRLIIARAGFYDSSEVNDWAAQFNRTAANTKCSPLLIGVDLDPILSFQHPKAPVKGIQGGTPSQPGQSYGTPVSTPQASMTSPDQYLTATPTPGGSAQMNASTPPEVTLDPNNESELTLLDPIEESWSVTLPFGLNQSHTILESRPAQASGLLLKRQGARDEDGVCRLGVNLIYSAATNVAVCEEILKDVLGQYRGLVTLARTRGCIDETQTVVPWHVAAAVKGARALDRWM